MSELSTEQWKTMSDALAAPFPPESVSWRVQGQPKPNMDMQVLAYIDARDVQDRLDAVVGAGNWSFDWVPVVTDAKGLQVVKGTITIHGVSKSDVGDASNFEGNKGAVSDAFKRAAVQWGIGRYLYGLDAFWVRLNEKGQIDAKGKAALRAKLTGKPLPAEQQPAPNRPAAEITIEQRRHALKAAYAAVGIEGKAWVAECCAATNKTKERLAAGFTVGDLEKIENHLKALKAKGAPIALDSADKAGVA